MTTSDSGRSAMVRGEAFSRLVTYAGRSIAGGRANNEDAFVCVPHLGLFAVADGMGGHNAGEVASALALDEVTAAVRAGVAARVARPLALVKAFEIANRHVFKAAQTSTELAGMGCTVSALLFASPLLVGAHVGDSRIYRLRGGELAQLTTDHSVPRMPHVLTRAVGSHETVDVDAFTTRVEPEDVFLLCTYGVTDVLPDAMLARLLASARRTPATAVDGILRSALPGARDNLTAVVLRIESRS